LLLKETDQKLQNSRTTIERRKTGKRGTLTGNQQREIRRRGNSGSAADASVLPRSPQGNIALFGVGYPLFS
jgi:hypothetical protein